MTKKIKFLGITVYKCKIKNGYRKKFILGICYNKKKLTTIYVNPKDEAKWIQKKGNENKELLIVNTDSIGDYILCRNFFKEIKKSAKYKNYKITLLGCEKYKAFAEYLDSDIIDKFIWVPERPQRLKSHQLIEIRNNLHTNQGLKHYYDTVVFPSYNSLDKFDAHNILTSAILYQEKILFASNPLMIKDCNRLLPFTHIYIDYKARELLKFEFDLNKSFYEDLLNEKLSLKFPYIENDKIRFNSDYLKNKRKEYVVINPCAYDNYRMWHPHNWQAVISYIQKIGYDVVILCGRGEEEYCRKLVDDAGLYDVDILANKPISELLQILKLAKMYIGQDSGIFHVAAALNIRALCLSAGNAYFRFMNYPKSRKNIKILFPEGTEDWILKNTGASIISDVNNFSINMLHMEKVKDAINQLLEIKDIIFIHKLRTKNTGDLVICPYDVFSDYFDNYIVQKFDNDDMGYLLFKKAIYILGGGGLINQNNDWNNWINILAEKNKIIGWGIGFNQHYDKSIDVKIELDKFALLGMRDYGKNVPYLPCVSCLKKELDIPQKIIRKIACIIHYENTKVKFDFPTMYNNQPFEELIKFIAESEVIITNTYHMVYWATLMGKKVVLFNPFSDRFDNFKYKPIQYSGDIEKDINTAISFSPEILKEARELNLNFFEKVKKVIEG